MSQLMQVCLLIILFYLIEPSVQSRIELSELLNDSIRKKQERSRLLSQTIEPLKSRIKMTFSNDHIPFEDAIMFIRLVDEIRRIQRKATSPPVYWYLRMG
jgi:hypothetical protein